MVTLQTLVQLFMSKFVTCMKQIATMADYFEDEGAYDYLFKVILLGDVDSRKMDFLCTYTGRGKDRSLGKSGVSY